MTEDYKLVLVIFGITGNLAQIKLLPALYDLAKLGMLPKGLAILGIGRKKFTNGEFREFTKERMSGRNPHEHNISTETEEKLLSKIHYLEGDINEKEIYKKIRLYLQEKLTCENKIFYLATYPFLYETIFNHLEKSGLNKKAGGFVRVMIEKPIGTDLKSARKINGLLEKYYKEDQIYRIDHYLTKEMMQNILTFRFDNRIFEQLINRDNLDHIQIIMAEEFGIELRGGYYERTGALKDIGQNHLLQMLALTTMQPPQNFTNEEITNKRIELLKSLIPEPRKIVFGQYEGYRKEKDVAPGSLTDTFFALRTEINNERFKGVPIYIRGGKKLAQTVAEVSFVFKKPDRRLTKAAELANQPNILIYRIQPNEGIVLRFLSKFPGEKMKLENEYMQFCYRNLKVNLPDAYLKILLDAFAGDQTFFIDAPELETQWEFIDRIGGKDIKPEIYKTGSWGPKAADKLIEADGRKWLEPSPVFCAL